MLHGTLFENLLMSAFNFKQILWCENDILDYN